MKKTHFANQHDRQRRVTAWDNQPMPVVGRHLLLWDGKCGLCRRATEWVRRRDRTGRFDIVPYQEATTPPMTPELRVACRRAMHVLTADGRTLRGGRASLFVLKETGNRRLAAVLSVPPFVWVVELAYRIVAKNRSQLSWLIFPARRA
jgi:predicted DCC family thiol-disulfide oxidoreductase YuxK